MFKLATVVAAIDATPEARRVLACANLVRTRDEPGTTFVLHVVPAAGEALTRVLFPLACLGDDLDAIRAELNHTARTLLRERFEAELQDIDDHQLRVAHGHVAETALDQLRTLGPDLLVVGANSADHPEPGVIGKDASRLARRAPCPTLVVRRRSGPARIRTILAAIDLTPDSAWVLEHALTLAHQQQSAVDAIHVIPSASALDHANVTDARNQTATQKSTREAARLFQQTASALKLPFAIRTDLAEMLQKPTTEHGDPGEAIVQRANDTQADLIVVQRCRTQGGSGMRIGRVAEYVLRHAPCDVLVLPPAVRAPETA